MSEVTELVAAVRGLGFKIESKGGQLKLVGKGSPSEDLIERLRKSKHDVLLYLRYGTDNWERLQALGSHLGERVRVDGREVTLWGITPRGPIVDTGAFLLTVEPGDVEVIST